MLPITAKTRTLADELEEAMKWCKNLEFVLYNCHDSSQLTERVGEFARNMPDFKILTAEKKSALDVVRKVCTGELSTVKAHDIVHQCHEELKYTRSLLNL